jgi:hypothetical protein
LTRIILEAAVSSQIANFEVAIQLVYTISVNLDAIITCDIHDFAGSELPVLSAKDFLKRSSLQ